MDKQRGGVCVSVRLSHLLSGHFQHAGKVVVPGSQNRHSWSLFGARLFFIARWVQPPLSSSIFLRGGGFIRRAFRAEVLKRARGEI